MSELYIPKKHQYIKLELQDDFPQTDLSEGNADMLKYILTSEAGLSAQAEHLRHYQAHIHAVANAALNIMGIKTRYAEDELASFSHGFASFETIHALVHPPRLYDMSIAVAQAKHLFLQPEMSLEQELAELIEHDGNTSSTLPTTPEINAIEFELADRQSAWVEEYPHTHDVIVEIGEKRDETLPQLHSRTAGAHFAYQLQHQDLDGTF